jgi:hypothetical protein
MGTVASDGHTRAHAGQPQGQDLIRVEIQRAGSATVTIAMASVGRGAVRPDAAASWLR